MRFQMAYRSHNIELSLTPTALMLRLQARSVPPIQVRVDAQPATLHAGHTYHFDLTTQAGGRVEEPLPPSAD